MGTLPLQRAEEQSARGAFEESPGTGPHRYTSSGLALAALIVLGLGFFVCTLFRVIGRYTHYDLRIVAHLVPARDHTHVLALIHPLVHLGDAAFVAAVMAGGMVVLWLMGYRHTWALLAGFLSWPAELLCKATLPQPDGLGTQQASVTLSSLVHGAGTKTVGGWLQHTAPDSLRTLAGAAGGISVNLVSSYPSGTTARATFALGLLIWLCLQADIPLISGMVALAMVAPLCVVGPAMVLYAWHWPSDVLGGYLLGFLLLAATLAALRRPAVDGRSLDQHSTRPALSPLPVRSSSSRSRLSWIPN